MSGGGGCDPAARVQSIAGEDLLGMIISTSTRARNGRRTVSVTAGEELGSFRRRRQRAVPKRSGRSRSVPSSCTRLGRRGSASLPGGESSTDPAGEDVARVGERSHIRASTVGSSVIFTNTKTWRSPNHVTWGSGFCGDSVGTDVTGLKGDSVSDARPVRASRCRSSSSAGRQALGFHPSVAPNRSRETPSYGTRSSVPVQRRGIGSHRDGRYAGEDGEFWGSER